MDVLQDDDEAAAVAPRPSSASSTAVCAANSAAAASLAELLDPVTWQALSTASATPGSRRAARAHGQSGGIPASSTAAPHPSGPSRPATSSSANRVLPMPAGPLTSTTRPLPARASASRARISASSRTRPTSCSELVTRGVSAADTYPVEYWHSGARRPRAGPWRIGILEGTWVA